MFYSCHVRPRGSTSKKRATQEMCSLFVFFKNIQKVDGLLGRFAANFASRLRPLSSMRASHEHQCMLTAFVSLIMFGVCKQKRSIQYTQYTVQKPMVRINPQGIILDLQQNTYSSWWLCSLPHTLNFKLVSQNLQLI